MATRGESDLFDKHELDIADIRKRCESSIRNTPVGVHLGKCLDEIERLRGDAERWQMAVIVTDEVWVMPERRKHAAEVAAFEKARDSGLTFKASIEAALERHNVGGEA